MLDTDEGI